MLLAVSKLTKIINFYLPLIFFGTLTMLSQLWLLVGLGKVTETSRPVTSHFLVCAVFSRQPLIL